MKKWDSLEDFNFEYDDPAESAEILRKRASELKDQVDRLRRDLESESYRCNAAEQDSRDWREQAQGLLKLLEKIGK
ncbi:hypothetical protein [Pannonibacter sp. P2PFMT1]|uniref:hypothetical protein n=1 Tax=Pannonibacter sp. P2PFMT1 TaxID=2003582 RepID=UPI001644F8E7|nr:hypothetical protein [Pannonibacter sp. P2PFMT1]